MRNTLYILRGVSGSGKTTLAKTLEESLPHAKAVAADDFWYMIGEGSYDFDIERLGEAHNWCKGRVSEFMKLRYNNIIVHNTNTTNKDIKPYMEMAEKNNYKVVSLVVENRHGNTDIHDVPDFVKERQGNNIKNSLRL